MKYGLMIVAISAIGVAPAIGEPAERLAPPHSGSIELSATYDGVLLVKVLDLTIDQQFDDRTFEANARLRSHGVLSIFKKIDVLARAEGAIGDRGPLPSVFEHANHDGQDNRQVRVQWTGADVVARIAPAYESPGDPAPTRAQKLAAADPLTQLARLTTASGARGPCPSTSQFFDGRQLYSVSFGAPAARTLASREIQLGLTQGVSCVLTFEEVAGFDPKPREKRNQGLSRPIRADFALKGADDVWVVTAVRGQTPLGEARIELKALSVSGSRGDGA